jgi:RNA polymerase sigma-54 factor
MAELSQNLQLRQQQRLVMTPQLKQALKILQLNTMELSQLVEQEIEQNPMLEELGVESDVEAPEAGGVDDVVMADVDAPNDGGVEAAAEAADAPRTADGEAPFEPGEAAFEAPMGDAPMGEAPTGEAPLPESTPEVSLDGIEGHELDDWAQYFDDDGTDYSLSGAGKEQGEEKEGFEAFLSRPETLQEHLLGQLDAEDLEGEELRLCEEVIGRVDERGYLEGTLEALAADCAAPMPAVFLALRRVQKLDPAGVAARDLRECLLLQLEARRLKDGVAWRAVEGHFDMVTHKRWDRLASVLKVAKAEAEAAEALIASLEPLPGRPFGGQPNAGVPVDAWVEKDPNSGQWKVLINDGGLPRLGFNGYYRRLMRQGGEGLADPETKAWLKDKQQSAVWLMRGIEQRHRTLRRVLEEIVAVQEGFLEQGPALFVPLILKDIASRTGLHESTISRVTTGKYVQTPRGVYELKYFFTSSLRTDQGGETSSRAVKDRLRELIGEEAPTHPLSDQDLAERLTRDGIQIARRTVAKYREELRIPPAHLRRRA